MHIALSTWCYCMTISLFMCNTKVSDKNRRKFGYCKETTVTHVTHSVLFLSNWDIQDSTWKIPYFILDNIIIVCDWLWQWKCETERWLIRITLPHSQKSLWSNHIIQYKCLCQTNKFLEFGKILSLKNGLCGYVEIGCLPHSEKI